MIIELDTAREILLKQKNHSSKNRSSSKNRNSIEFPVFIATKHTVKASLFALLLVIIIGSLFIGIAGLLIYWIVITNDKDSFSTIAICGILTNYFFVGITTFINYYFDKRSARLGNWRTSEAQLHYLELAGGWIGALLAQKLLRHKNKKSSFQLVYWLIIFFHISFLLHLIPNYALVIPQKYIFALNMFLLIVCIHAIYKKGYV